jgi:hypothetical protein
MRVGPGKAAGLAVAAANALAANVVGKDAKNSCFAAYLRWASPFFCGMILLVLARAILYGALYMHIIEEEHQLAREEHEEATAERSDAAAASKAAASKAAPKGLSCARLASSAAAHGR